VADVTLPQFKAMVTVPPGGEVIMHLPGGGGYGDPRERPVARVAADVANGLLTPERARRDYGVVLRRDRGGLQVDAAATARGEER
jgi:N-methylhydantoinase B